MGYNQGFNKQYVQVIIYYYTHRHGFCSKEWPVFPMNIQPKVLLKDPCMLGIPHYPGHGKGFLKKKEKINK